MKFKALSPKRFTVPVLAAAAALGLGACATPSNRRALYFPPDGNGPWHQFALRQSVAADLGVPASSLPRPSTAITTTTTTTVVAKPGAAAAVGPASTTPLVPPTVPAAGSLAIPGGAPLPVPSR